MARIAETETANEWIIRSQARSRRWFRRARTLADWARREGGDGSTRRMAAAVLANEMHDWALTLVRDGSMGLARELAGLAFHAIDWDVIAAAFVYGDADPGPAGPGDPG